MADPLPNRGLPNNIGLAGSRVGYQPPPATLPPHLQRSGSRILTNTQGAPAQQPREKKPEKARKSIISFPSDRNGCGFYRTIIPFNYLISKHEYDCSELFTFNFDLNFITRASTIRFQRQVTDAQVHVMREYKKVITNTPNSNANIVYEIDDLVHEIEMSNIVAYQFYTPTRRNNMIEAMRLSDKVTVSTEFLKQYYEDKFDVQNIHVIPNYLPKFLWQDKGKRDKSGKGKKPRILWAGSASHVGRGGDLEFLLPLIKKTKKEFQWVFFGVIPPELKGKPEYEFHEWADFWSYPHALDQIDADVALCPIKDTVFNYGKSDLKILEYTALNIPFIASSIGNGLGPYDLVDGINIVENDADSWYNAIKQLATDGPTRDKYMKAAQAELTKRWLEDEDNIQKYLDVY